MASPTTDQIKRLIRNEIARAVRIIPSDSIFVKGGDHPMQPSVITAPAGGFVQGPASSTLSAIALWDNTTGDLLKDSKLIVLDGGGIIVLSTPDGTPADELSLEPGESSSGDGADLDLRGGDSDLGAAGDVTISGGSQLPGATPTGGNIDLFATNARSGSSLPGGIIRLQGGTNDDGSGPAFVHIRSSDLKVDGDVFANAFIATASSMTFTAPSGQTVDTIVDVTTVMEVAEALVTVNVDLDLDGNDINMGGGSILEAVLISGQSILAMVSAAGNNAISITGGSNSSGNGSPIVISGGASTGGGGDGGSILLTVGGGNGAGTDGTFVVTDGGAVAAIRVTGASTPVVEIGRSLNPLSHIILLDNNRIGPGTGTNLVFIDTTSAVIKVNTDLSLTITDAGIALPIGNRIDLDADDDTSIRCSGDDILTFEIGGSDQVVFSRNTITVGSDGVDIYTFKGVTRATGDLGDMEFEGANATSAGDGQSFRFHCGNAAATGSHDGGGFTIDLGALIGISGDGGAFTVNAAAGGTLFTVLDSGTVIFGGGTNINAAGTLDMDGQNILDIDNILVLDGGIIGSGVNDNFIINVGTDITFTVNSVNCLDITPTLLDGKSVLRLVNFAGRRENRQWGFPSANTATNRSLEGLTRSNHGNGGVFTPNRPGSIVGMNACIDVNVIGSGGDIEFQVRKNGSTVYTVTLVAPGVANKHQVHDTQAVGVDTFVAGDIIEVRRVLVNGGAGQITTDDTEMDVEFEFDT